MQNKIHYAIHGQTAAEVIYTRADAKKEFMKSFLEEGIIVKKILTLVLCLGMTISLVGCGNASKTESNKSSEIVDSTQTLNDKDGETVNKEMDSNKELLMLQYLPQLSLEQSGPDEQTVDIAYSGLSEIMREPYRNNPELNVFADYIEDNLNIKLDDNWNVIVRFFDDDKMAGIVEFMYSIGEIGTNKSISFSLSDGKADMVFYTHLDEDIDEEALQNRVLSFKEKYVQEQYQLKDGEKLEEETAYYTYYYDTGDLVYNYNVFFSYDEELINNDYGTICFIDENGNAVFQ